MGHHTFDAGDADKLEDAARRYRHLSRDELLGALAPTTGDVVADLGSGTGFYTDDIAARVGSVHAVDVQPAMHDYYRTKGVPENVTLVTSSVADLPFARGHLDGAVSTMTYHEFATPAALAEVARVLVSGGRFVVADWSANGDGEAGPPLAERYDAAHAARLLDDADFTVEHRAERPETFVVVGVRE
jgi:ubiquinone/menaquinone biosynthesis C-methylase UbiE